MNEIKKYIIGLLLILFSISSWAQTAPGGVNTGTVRGYKADMYIGNFANTTLFGTGTANATPTVWGYTGTVRGREFVTQRGDFYGMEYNGILEVPQTGTYTFQLTNVNEIADLFISTDGGVNYALVVSRTCCGNSVTATRSLAAGGNVRIRIKYIETSGTEDLGITWSGPGLTGTQILDGRFVRVDNASLSHWYKADNANTITAGANTYISSYINQAPSFTNQGNATLNSGGAWTKLGTTDNLVNYNTAAQFDGNDNYLSRNVVGGVTYSSNGLAYQNAPFQAFNTASYTGNISGSNWVWGHGYDCNSNNFIGQWKSTNAGVYVARSGTGILGTSTYILNEPKIEETFHQLLVGNTASRNIVEGARGNAGTFGTAQVFDYSSQYINTGGIQYGGSCSANVNAAYMPEFIYYPFKLTDDQSQKVNTYLAVKYGTTLVAGNYVAPNDAVVWNRSTNATYTNRVFGIARDDAEALYQKQSQSRMRPSGNLSSEFLKLSKGTLQTTNAANTGVLPNNTYLLVGDDNTAMATQTTEIPASINDGSCNFVRLTREWRAQVTGTPGDITVVAGSADVGSFIFSNSMTGIALMVDADGDGNFNTGTIRTYPYTTLVNGVATFNNVLLNNNEVFTFVWKQTAPGGVSSGLQHWLKANDGTAAGTMTRWDDLSGNARHMTNVIGSPTLVNNQINYNPSVSWNGSSYFGLGTGQTTFTQSYTAGEVFSLLRASANNVQRSHLYDYGSGARPHHYTWDNGAIYEGFGTNDIYGYNPLTGSIPDGKTGMSALAFTFNATDFNLYNTFSAANNWGINVNGRTLSSTSTNTVSFNNSTQIWVGSVQSWTGSFQGLAPEIILYNRVLTPAERNKVNTYLALKYSQTLDQTSAQNYTSSNLVTPIWNGTTNSAYKNHIFGIGRDDCSGLDQRQSYSNLYGSQTNVKVGLGTINEGGNSLNSTSFAADQQFLLMGALFTGSAGYFSQNSSTDIPAAYTAISCNPKRWNQAYKVANTGTVPAVQVKIGTNALGLRITKAMTNLRLVVDTDGDNNLSTGSPVLYTMASRSGNEAVFNSVLLPDGATFTLIWTEATPGAVAMPTNGTTIGGQTFVNGLEYKLYTGTSTQYPASLDLNPLSVMPGTLQSTGYLSSLTGVPSIFSSRLSTNYGVEISGKIFVPTTSTTYQFRGLTIDDQVNIKINGVSILNQTVWPGAGVNVTSANIPLTAGYHDIVIRLGNSDAAISWNITWNGGSGSTFTAIPDANFFVRPTGPSVWYAADDGSFSALADGATVPANTIWYDQSLNGNNLKSINNPLYYSITASKLRNFNEVLEQTDDRFTDNNAYPIGFSFGKMPSSMMLSASVQAGTRQIFGYGHPNSTSNFRGLWASPSTTTLNYWTNGNDYLISSYFTANSGVFDIGLIGAINQNINIVTSNNISIFKQGRLFSSGQITTPANQNTIMDSGINIIQLGGRFDGNGMTGSNYETLLYPWALSANEQLKVNSYLAIRWGHTLDQTSATNYLASDGTTIWDATFANQGANGNFNNDITGIGRDDCGALSQKQSTSTDGNDIMSFGLTKLEANNNQNLNEFATDKSYLFLAHNGADLQTNTTNMPAALSTANCFVKLNRVWQVQRVGTGALPLQLSVGKKGQIIFRSVQEVRLLVSNSPTNFSAAIVYPATAITGGTAKFDNITLTHGQYIAIAFINASPGGVSSGLVRWYSADIGIYTDQDGIEPAINDNDAIQLWTDNSNFAADAFQASSGSRPKLIKNSTNFNPALDFDGVNDGLISNNYTGLPVGSSLRSSGLMAMSRDINPTTTKQVFSYGAAACYNEYGMAHQVVSSNATLDVFCIEIPRPGTFNSPGINRLLYGQIVSANTGALNVNLEQNITNSLPGTLNTQANNFSIGYERISNVGFWNGTISEFFIFNRLLTSNEEQRIGSFHAIKYGITLSILNNSRYGDKSYLDAQSNPVYSYTGFWNRITGIGRDYCGGLDQRQSLSVDQGALVTVSSDASGGVANSNLENPVEIDPAASGASYLIFGDDNKPLAWDGERTFVKDNKLIATLQRSYRVNKTGTVGAVHVQVSDAGGVTYNPNQAFLPNHIGTVYLVVANAATNGNFLAPSGVTIKEMIYVDATKTWQVAHDFAAGDYFTFASEISCVGPAGISGNLQLWLKANDGTGQTTQGAAVSTWTDASPSANNGTGVNNPAFQASGAGVMNYNPSVSFNGTNQYFNLPNGFSDFTAGASSFVVRKRNGTTSTLGRFFHLSTGGNNNSLLFNRDNNTENIRVDALNASSTVLGTSFVSTNTPLAVVNPNIMGFTLQGGTSGQTDRTFKYFYNGALNSSIATAAVPITINRTLNRIGAGGSATEWMNGFIPEVILYNTQLTDLQSQKVNTYLAIKYGVTSGSNYISPVFDGTTNIAAETLYNVATFGNRIFGVGIDKTGCLVQNQSKNQEGGLVAISVDGVINTLNSADDTKWTNDRNYIIMGDDNKSISSFVRAGSIGNEPIPAIYSGCMIDRVNRHWKVQVKGEKAPNVFISIPANTSSETVKLPALPSVGTLQSYETQKVYLVINENPDFTIDANMQEVELTLNGTNYEATFAVNPNEAANNTFYYTIVTRVNPCRENCLKSNKNVKSDYIR